MKSLIPLAGGALLLSANSVAAQPTSPPPQVNPVACPMAGNGVGPMAGAGVMGPGMMNSPQMRDQMQAMHDQMMAQMTAMHTEMQGMHQEMMKLRQDMSKHH